MNLLDETKGILFKNGHEMSDIEWVGCKDFRIGIDEFIKLADVEYDSGYGGQMVATDLMVVGADWFLERHEYDGAEWWEYKTMPQMPQQVKSVTRIVADSWGSLWETLKQMNEEGAEE